MKNNKPKRPLLTAGLVVSIFAIILSWTELGVPLSILAAALILTEIARSKKVDFGSGKLIASVVMIVISLFIAVPILINSMNSKDKPEPEVVGLKVREACQKIKDSGWDKITISGKFAGYSLREGGCTDENIVKTVYYNKMFDEVSLAFEIDKKADLTESELAKYQEMSSKTEADKKPSNKSTSSGQKSSGSAGVSPAFKKSMDDYAAFMDKYVDVMKRYKASPSDATVMAEYAEFMKKYAEFTESINKVDHSSLSAVDAAYYLEVTSRVTKKLAELQ